MKYLNYIAFLVLLAIASACSDKNVEYNMEPVDTAHQAELQIFYMTPKTAVSSNYIYQVGINGINYANNGSTLITTFNGVPGGAVGMYYTVASGDVTITLFHRLDGVNIDAQPFYTGKARGLKAGGKYQVFVVDDNADPIVLEAGEMPTFGGSTQTAEYCGTKWYNFMYEADGTPSTDKLQLYIQGDSTKQYDEPLGKPIGFGECTDWESLHVTKTVYNSQGYQSRYYTFHVIDGTTGEDKGQLEYVSNTAGRVKAFTDYWTWYIGRQYRLYVHGVRTSKTVRVALSRWTAY